MKKQIKNALTPTANVPAIIPAAGDDAAFARYVREIQKFPILSASQEYEYATNWVQNHDMAAAEKLVASHLRLVVSVAYDFKNYGIPVSDLVASGNMGLMQALHKFDPERGFRFSTYAMFWIRAEIYETILNNWSIVKIGTSANQKRVFFNLARAKRALGIMDGNMSDDQTRAVADYLGVPAADVRRMSTRIAARDVSLNAPARSDDGTGTDILSNMTDNSENAAELLESAQSRARAREIIGRHLAALPDRDREILVARRMHEPVVTLDALAKKYGISRERVRQIEQRAFTKIRDAILGETGGKDA